MNVDISALGTFILMLLNITNITVLLARTARTPNKERDATIAELEKTVENNERKADDNLKSTERKIMDRIEELDRKVDAKIKEYDETIGDNLDNINEVRETMLSSTEVIMRSLQALTLHALDNNHIDQLRTSQNELNEYLLTGQLRGRRHEQK